MDPRRGIGNWIWRDRPHGADAPGRYYARPVRDASGDLLAVDILCRAGTVSAWRAGPDMALAWAASRTDREGARLLAQLRAIGIATTRRVAPPLVMGIVNVTPDSFSDGGKAETHAAAIAQGDRLAAEGAAILDVGGESTRPGSGGVSLEEEWRRIAPVLEHLVGAGHTVSVDTRKAEVMRRAIALGVPVINDVTALTHEPASLPVVAGAGVEVVLMHSQGDPSVMQQDPTYDDVVLDVFDWLEERVRACTEAGIAPGRLVIDPGIGFGKTWHQNLALLRHLPLFEALGCRMLVGASRKAFIGWLTGVETAGDRLGGSVGAALAAVEGGADIVRVHDVAPTAQALAVRHAAVHGLPAAPRG
ncbi:MAG: dihydropteroate synthase [Pseudomonadota bacterium]|nr:dihydropteroate synthase [Pseudomonadota bacterium]